MSKKLSTKKKIFILIIAILVMVVSIGIILIPKLSLKGEKSIELEVGSDYKDAGYNIKSIFKDPKVKVNSNVDNTKLGNYNITYSIDLKLFKLKTTREVEVKDTTSPIIELIGEEMVNVCPNKKYEDEGYKANDNYDGDITDRVEVDISDERIKYSVKDSSNNESTITRNIKYIDDTNPELKLNGADTLYYYVGNKYSEPGYTAIDNCDGDITSNVVVTNNINMNSAGTYKVDYSVKDSNNNEATTSRTIVVSNISKPSPSTCTGEAGVIYLTFDDGPSDGITSKILDILAKYNVKATFFVTMNGSDSMIKREHNEGHTVALHTATHNYQYIYSSVDNYYEDLYRVQNRVKNITGVESKIVRFPGGSSNTVSRNYKSGIMTYLSSDLINKGFRYYDWNISSGDAGNTTDPNQIYNNVVSGLSKSCSNVVLMHDTHTYTMNAVEGIVKYGLDHGYTFKRIDEATAMVRHGVNN